jgi:hypothetical protein
VNGSAKQKLAGHSKGLKSTLATPANGRSNGAIVIANDAGTRPRNSVRKGRGSAAAPGKNTGSEATVNTPSSDRKLIDQALGGVAGAWDVLYHRCHQPLLTAIRAIVGPRSADPNLVDELAARVWYAVVRDQGRLLDRFDPRRECTLTTYLALLAKDEASRLFRSERRRRRREAVVAGASNDAESPANSRHLGTSAITLEEFARTLTPAEKSFYDDIVLRDNGDTPDSSATGANRPRIHRASEMTQSNQWQLNHRVRRKLERFLTGDRS